MPYLNETWAVAYRSCTIENSQNTLRRPCKCQLLLGKAFPKCDTLSAWVNNLAEPLFLAVKRCCDSVCRSRAELSLQKTALHGPMLIFAVCCQPGVLMPGQVSSRSCTLQVMPSSPKTWQCSHKAPSISGQDKTGSASCRCLETPSGQDQGTGRRQWKTGGNFAGCSPLVCVITL